MPWKNVFDGDIVQAVDVNLAIDQGFLSFADVAERDFTFAVSVPKDGAVCYLVDSGTYQKYDLATSTWVGFFPIWQGSQAEYDAIGTKDPNILYVVTS